MSQTNLATCAECEPYSTMANFTKLAAHGKVVNARAHGSGYLYVLSKYYCGNILGHNYLDYRGLCEDIV